MRTRARWYALIGVVVWAAAQGAPAANATPGPDAHTQIAWSRFADLDFSAARIVIADTHGAHVRELTHSANGVQDIDPKFSPDGRRLIFERDLPDGTVRIVVVNADGTGERSLRLDCDDPCVGDLSPTWAPDGRHIYFTRLIGPFDQVNGSARSAVLYRSDLHGRGLTRISPPGIDGAYEDYLATFAPAGYRVFIRIRNADIKSAVFRADADGTTVQLTPWSIDADEASVSPAASGPSKDLVVFETFGHGPPDGVAPVVATVPATCGSLDTCSARVRYLTSPKSLPVQHFNPAWSPSGLHIAYVRFDPAAQQVTGDIWSMNWNGAARTPVSTSPLFEFRPAWGPATR